MPCGNHSLNLVGVHSASAAVNSVAFFGTAQRVYTFFSSSTHRWNVLSACIKISVKRVSATLWSARCDAVKTLEQTLVSCFLLCSLFRFCFYLWDKILTEINDAQKYLQTKGLHLSKMALKLMSLQESLKTKRD